MKNTVIEIVKYCFTREHVTRLSNWVDEPAPNVEQALQQAIPLVLNELVNRVGRGLTPDALLGLVREADSAQVLTQLADFRSTPRYERGLNLLLDLMGDSYRGTVSRIADGAGMHPMASDTLLQVAATAVLGVLGGFATDKGFTPTDFVYWLHAHKEDIAAAMLPAALPGTMMRLPTGEGLPPQPTELPMQLMPLPAAAGPETSSGAVGGGAPTAYWQWGTLLLLAVCLGYYFGHGMMRQAPQPAAFSPATETSMLQAPTAAATLADEATAAGPEPAPGPAALVSRPEPAIATRPVAAATPAPTPAAEVAAGAYQPASVRSLLAGNEPNGRYDQDRDTYIYDTGRPIVLTLSDGTTQKVGANSTENRLYTFLASPAFQVDSVNRTKGWINFDRINFEAGQSLLTPESALQLGNIASILTTFPNSIVKIGGYTDSTGDPLKNYQLSEDRARAAMVTLASMGVSAGRLQAKGYGPKYFVRPNNTATGRALNRRVSIRVLRK